MAKSELASMEDMVELAILGEGEFVPVVEDSESVAKDIIYRILTAEDEDAIFGKQSATSAVDILDIPLEIQSVRWSKSEFTEEGPAVYALIEANRMDDGSPVVISCGSRNVMSQLLACQRQGLLPLKTPKRFRQSGTGTGRKVLWLENVS